MRLLIIEVARFAKTEKLECCKVTGPFFNSDTYFYSVSGLGAGSM